MIIHILLIAKWDVSVNSKIAKFQKKRYLCRL